MALLRGNLRLVLVAVLTGLLVLLAVSRHKEETPAQLPKGTGHERAVASDPPTASKDEFQRHVVAHLSDATTEEVLAGDVEWRVHDDATLRLLDAGRSRLVKGELQVPAPRNKQLQLCFTVEGYETEWTRVTAVADHVYVTLRPRAVPLSEIEITVLDEGRQPVQCVAITQGDTTRRHTNSGGRFKVLARVGDKITLSTPPDRVRQGKDSFVRMEVELNQQHVTVYVEQAALLLIQTARKKRELQVLGPSPVRLLPPFDETGFVAAVRKGLYTVRTSDGQVQEVDAVAGKLNRVLVD